MYAISLYYHFQNSRLQGIVYVYNIIMKLAIDKKKMDVSASRTSFRGSKYNQSVNRHDPSQISCSTINIIILWRHKNAPLNKETERNDTLLNKKQNLFCLGLCALPKTSYYYYYDKS